MKFTVLTLFPDMIEHAFTQSITGRALEEGILELRTIDIRQYAHNRYLSVDDYPFGGGAGMVMEAQPVFEAYEEAMQGRPKGSVPVIYLSPAGKPFTQAKARQLSELDEIILLCGHYEGIDQRIIDEIVTEEISAGDYVLTGGELPALMVMDAVSRLVPGVLGNEDSPREESFSGMWLEYPQYTRPREFHGRSVPDVLLSGNHAEIRQWRLRQAVRTTLEKRPDLIRPEQMTEEEKAVFQEESKPDRP